MEQAEKNTANTRYFWVAITVLCLLTTSLAYLYWHERQLNLQKEERIEAQIKAQYETKNKIDSLTRELSYKILEIKKLGGDVASFKKLKDALEADKVALNAKKYSDISFFEKRISEYQKILAEKDNEIVSLKKQFGALSEKNETLNSENLGLKTEKQRLSDSINFVTAKNKELNDKVTLAAALRAETINVYAISPRGKETDGGQYNSKKIDKLRITFHLVDNPLTKTDEKDIYMRILEPTGSVISNMALGSGIFQYKGQDVIYTTKRRETYQNNHQLVEFIYSRGQEFRPGNYQIELYAEGHKIGQGVFQVK